MKRVVVWGTGNVGQPALRAVIGHKGLALVGVVVSSPAKEGKDAGELAGVGLRTGVNATRDWQSVLAAGCDAVVYTASAEMRFGEAWDDVLACLSAGANVVTSSIYPLLYKPHAPADWIDTIAKATASSGASIMVSGVDPGWAMDALPLFVAGVSTDITEVRCQELMNYAYYDSPKVVRELIGFGGAMDELPMMLQDFALQMVWGPMVRSLGDALDRPVEQVTTHVERRPLEHDVDVPGMGIFKAGGQGAFRFEVRGHHAGKPLFVLEHVTRIDNACAPDWPYPPNPEGVHRVRITGNPSVEVTVHATDRYASGAAAGGNAIAACRLVNSIPYVCDAPAGVVESWRAPAGSSGALLRD